VALKKRPEEALFMSYKKINSGKILESKAGLGSKYSISIYKQTKQKNLQKLLLQALLISCSVIIN
jgi:hypothetical protein